MWQKLIKVLVVLGVALAVGICIAWKPLVDPNPPANVENVISLFEPGSIDADQTSEFVLI